MEEYDLEPVIEAINLVYDNIWVGDLVTAKELAETNLIKIQAELDLSKIKKSATELKELVQKVRKDAREKEVKKRRLWVADRLSEVFKKEGFEPIENIYGILAIHLTSLKEAVTYLIEAQAQQTLESLVEENSEKEKVFQRKERYRYTIQRLPDRWEVHAFLDTPTHAWDLRKFKRRLVQYDFAIEEVSKTDSSRILELYSRNMYIQVLGQNRLVEMLIRIRPTKKVSERVDSIVETIISSLIA